MQCHPERMRLSAYRPVLAVPATRLGLLLGLLIRIPMFAVGVILTLHVVASLGRSYAAAGLATAASTVAVAISGPWRGRLLDRRGLRQVVLPSLVVQAVCWSVAPWVSYWPLLALAAVAGLFAVPTFSIVRQIIINAVPDEQRRTALSLDSIATEIAFMAGPALGVWVVTVGDTRWAMLTFAWLSILGGVALWVLDPALKGASASEWAAGPPPLRRDWVGLPALAVLAAAAATTVVLTGSDVSIIAVLRDMRAPQHIGWVLALWALGSIVGAVVYGAWHRSVSVFWLLGGLAALTLPVALAMNLPMLAVLLVLSGLFCAPTITATVDNLSHVVPERSRGEAMGWHASSMTAGSALGAPLAGLAIDRAGWEGGFVSVSLLGLAVAVVGGGVMLWRRSRLATGAASAPGASAHLGDPVAEPTRRVDEPVPTTVPGRSAGTIGS